MTLITTAISSYGIVHASDSNLTSGAGVAGTGQKVFRLGFADAALALAGAYSVGGQSMEDWMPATIAEYAATDRPRLREFAYYLGCRLSEEMNDEERQGGSLMHIAGYVEQDGAAHPEFFFVRNIEGIHPRTGAYVGRTKQFQVTEDFWTRDYLKHETRQALAEGGHQRYFNGTPDGRIVYLALSSWLRGFFGQVWANQDWRFRPPRSLDELASFVGLEIRAICTMFVSSDYSAPYIGGEVQIEKFEPPPNAVAL